MRRKSMLRAVVAGILVAGGPLPGVTVTAQNTLTGKRFPNHHRH
jgi:hypothetical protein